MHMLNDADTWEVLKEKGVQDWIEEKLRIGQIRNIGFLIMEIRRILRGFWTLMTGISVRSSITIWMRIRRREEQVFCMHRRRESRW